MIKHLLLLLLCTTTSQCVLGQDKTLQTYLEGHQAVISRRPDSSLVLSKATEAILDKMMQGRNLLVLGEGGSHYLHLNGDLWLMCVSYLSQHGLKYVFEEGARAWAMEDNYFLQHPEIRVDDYYPFANKHARANYERQRAIYMQGSKFRIIGIDFERGQGMHKMLTAIMNRVGKENAEKLYRMASHVRDTGYVKYDAKAFKRFYRKTQEDFYRDSSTLKGLLGAEYTDFKYLLTNNNINTPYGARNGPMADNLLAEIVPMDGSATYFLDCGMDHSRPNIKGSLVNRLSESDVLKGKIAVMNVVCDSCTTSVEPTSNWAFPFMKGSVMESFRNAAGGDIVLFDLSALPEQYDYIRAYGDMLVFGRHQH